jgi:excisionase family DNA binding protein
MAKHPATVALDEQLLTISEVSDLLRISRTSVYRLIERGDLEPLRVGERVRFAPAEIRRYLAPSRKVGVP